ncbi:MAG: AAA family ATPase [Bacilli bacterium]|jgi:chromosome partitioning protein
MTTRIIAIANQKGGVGKTTTAINLSSSLAHFSRRVLLIDMDPQGNSSRGVGVDSSLLQKGIYDALVGDANINKIMKRTAMKNLDIVPSNIKLASLDASVMNRIENPYFILKETLSHLEKTFDYIIIDCPPSLGLLNINALVSATSVLIPVQCEYFAMEGVAQILAAVSRIQSQYNPYLKIEGFLFTMYDSRTRLGTEVTTQIRGLFKENTFLTSIPRNISLPESTARGIPVTIYRPTSSGSLAYLSLAKEVIEHEERE